MDEELEAAIKTLAKYGVASVYSTGEGVYAVEFGTRRIDINPEPIETPEPTDPGKFWSVKND